MNAIKIFFLLLTLYSQSSFAQTNINQLKEEKAEIVLLKNQDNLIPLKNLGENKILSFVFGMPSDNEFQATLEKYTTIQSVAFDGGSLQNLINLTKKYTSTSSLIIGVNLEKQAAISEELFSLMTQFARVPRTVFVFFGSAEELNHFPLNLKETNHLLYVSNNNDRAQSLAAQLIFGGIGAKDKISIAAGGFEKGSGLTSKGDVRLKYSSPETVGVDEGKLKKGISEIIEEGLAAKAFPGAQVLVAKNGHVIYHETFGYHTYAQERTVSLTDIYDFASLTKVTGPLPALMKLHGENKFDLEAPLKEYFPKFSKSNKANLTYRSILAHQAQLKPWIPYWQSTIKENGKFKSKTLKRKPSKRYPIKLTDNLYLHKKFKEKKLYKAIKEAPMNEKEGYAYSGLAFYLFPEIIENITKQDYEIYLKKNFYHRLGANTITYNPYLHFPLEEIIPTERDTFFRKFQIHGRVHDEGAAMMDGVSGNAGLFGTSNDLAKLLQMYLNKGIYGGELYINPESVEEFTKCQYCEDGNHRGLGFDKPLIEYHPVKSSTAKSASSTTYGHSGYTGTLFWVDPTSELIYIFFSNRVYPTRTNRKIYNLNLRPRIHQAIYDSFEK